MPINDLITRNYAYSDDEMLEMAQVFHDNFITDKADFIAFSLQFNDPFGANFQTAIDDADALPTYQSDLGYMATLTAAVDEKMEECRLHYKKLIFHLKSAFDNKESVLQDFRQNMYSKWYNSTTSLIELMQLAHTKADSATYKAGLIAAGFLQADIDELGTLAEALQQANRLQEEWKSGSVVRAQTRIIAYNAVWAIMVKINEASKLVYADDPAKILQYQLYVSEGENGRPGAPRILRFDEPTTKFEWDAVEGATDYLLVYRAQGDTDWLEVDKTTETWVIFTPGAGSWQFKVVGNYGNVVGYWSDVLLIVIL